MKKIAMVLTIASAIWWALFWLVLSAAFVFLLSVPNTGSIINLTTTWQMVAIVLPMGPLGLWLLWAAYRSLRGTVALIGVALSVLVLSFVNSTVQTIGMLFLPLLILLPLLWYRHRN